MNRRSLHTHRRAICALAGSVCILALALASCSRSDRRQDRAGDEQSTGAEKGGAPAVSAGPVMACSFSPAFTHKNLSIFLIRGPDRVKKERRILTLEEALKQKKVVVHETEDVNELEVENTSDEEVFINSGDIVKGGKQDRCFGCSVVLPPRSGKVKVGSFCVEQGRWSGRGGESTSLFSSSNEGIVLGAMKLAAVVDGDQSQVWSNVGKLQNKLARGVANADTNIYASAEANAAERLQVASHHDSFLIGPSVDANAGQAVQVARNNDANGIDGTSVAILADNAPLYRQGTIRDLNASGITYLSVRDAQSPSSLQLTLENPNVQKMRQEYIDKLADIPEGKGDVIGYAVVINGKVVSADVYASSDLFRRLWPKLLRSSATEAVAEFQKDKTFDAVTADDVRACMDTAEKGKAYTKADPSGMNIEIRKADRQVLVRSADANGTTFHDGFMIGPAHK